MPDDKSPRELLGRDTESADLAAVIPIRTLTPKQAVEERTRALAAKLAPAAAPAAPPCPCARRRPPPPGYRGHVVCDGCDRVYTTHDPKLPSHAPVWCDCTMRLMPGPRLFGLVLVGREYSARVICLDCVVGRIYRGAGMV